MERVQKQNAFLFLAFTILGSISLFYSLYYAVETLSYISAIIIGGVILLISIVFHQMGKVTKPLYIISYTLNYISTGFSLSAIYTYTKTTIEPSLLMTALLVMILAFLIYVLIDMIVKTKYGAIITSIVLVVGLTITYWITNEESVYLLVSPIAICNMVGHFIAKEKPNTEQIVSFSSFGVYLLVTMIALIVVSEGDALEGVGTFGSGGKKPKEQNL